MGSAPTTSANAVTSAGATGGPGLAVTALPAAPATRWRRPGWRDPRFAVGVLLVAGSVALGSWLVGTAQRTTAVWVATTTLVPGSVVADADLTTAEVRLDGAELGHYLAVTGGSPAGTTVLRVVQAGELLPAGALGEAAEVAVRAVAVAVPGALSTEIAPGAVVDLWQVADAEGPVTPAQVAAGLTVAEVDSADGGFTLGRTVVHVLVPEARLADVLAATSGDGEVRLLPVPGTARR